MPVVVRADQSGSVTGQTRLCGCLDHPRAQTLAGHFHQTKARNATHLNAGAVGFQLVLHPLFNGSIVLALVHVDEVDDDQTCKVTQAQLTGHFFGGFEVCLGCGFLDRAFFGGSGQSSRRWQQAPR